MLLTHCHFTLDLFFVPCMWPCTWSHHRDLILCMTLALLPRSLVCLCCTVIFHKALSSSRPTHGLVPPTLTLVSCKTLSLALLVLLTEMYDYTWCLSPVGQLLGGGVLVLLIFDPLWLPQMFLFYIYLYCFYFMTVKYILKNIICKRTFN